MARNLTKLEWLEVISICNDRGADAAAKRYCQITGFAVCKQAQETRIRLRIRKKVILVQNEGMEALDRKYGTGLKASGRPKKRDDSDIPSIIDELTEEQKREIIEHWIKEQRDKKDKSEVSSIKAMNPTLMAKVLGMHRTTFYKHRKQREYKFDWLESKVREIFFESKQIYGSRKIAALLRFEGVDISDRTLRTYMQRWNLLTVTRRKRRKAEIKNTNVKFTDLVNRNFNPEVDNIIATDVSYIPADEEQNNVYFSIAISHKTKLIEAWALSKNNDNQIVIDTIKGLHRTNFIFHSDHGSQYSSPLVRSYLNAIGGITSMGRIGNSLDNREAEYFFSCLKSEYLYHINTASMKFEDIYKHIEWYVNWYNNRRIQKVLQWKTPAYASVYSHC